MRRYKQKARRWPRRKEKRFQCHVEVPDNTCQELLDGVWHLDWSSTAGYRGVPPDPYVNYWSDCVQTADQPDLMLDDRRIAVALVGCVRDRLNVEIKDVKEQIRQELCIHVPGKVNASEDEAQTALEFATSLWMHVLLDFTDCSTKTLRDIVQESLPERSDPNTVNGSLGEDLCVKSLRRKGGIRVQWTNNLCEHLTCYEDTVKVFRNSSMLRALSEAAISDPQRSPFSAEFLTETLQTLYLLFRPMEVRSARANARYMEKNFDADLELAMGKGAEFELRNYPFWHSRLEKLQKAYDKKTPSGLTQWWFDRRDRVQWATFWVAFVVFLLTVIFGIISSVTGVLQVYAAYRLTG